MAKNSTKAGLVRARDEKEFLFPSNGHGGENQLSEPYPFSTVRTTVHDENTVQKLVTVTEDKMLICFNKHLRRIGKKRWVHPLSLLATLLLALATSEFDKLHWMSAELLRALFILSSVITAAWLIWEVMHAGRMKELPDVVDDIFGELRGKYVEDTPGARLHSKPSSPVRFMRWWNGK